MKRTLYIVSVYRPDLLPELLRTIGVTPDVDVVMDRRVGERRQPQRAESEESRRLDRRRNAVDEALRTQGFAVVTLD